MLNLVHIGISLSFGVLLHHDRRMVSLLLLRPNLEQVIVFFVDVAYLPNVTHHYLRILIVALHSTVLKCTIHQH